MVPKIGEMVSSHIKIEEKKQEKTEDKKDKTIHYGVACDGCDVCPIVGNCYKSSGVHDFDFCEKCEATKKHDYPFLKLTHPS